MVQPIFCLYRCDSPGTQIRLYQRICIHARILSNTIHQQATAHHLIKVQVQPAILYAVTQPSNHACMEFLTCYTPGWNTTQILASRRARTLPWSCVRLARTPYCRADQRRRARHLAHLFCGALDPPPSPLVPGQASIVVCAEGLP